jgi:hypothetical protein
MKTFPKPLSSFMGRAEANGDSIRPAVIANDDRVKMVAVARRPLLCRR